MIKLVTIKKRLWQCSNCPYFAPTLGENFYCNFPNRPIKDYSINILNINRFPKDCPLETEL